MLALAHAHNTHEPIVDLHFCGLLPAAWAYWATPATVGFLTHPLACWASPSPVGLLSKLFTTHTLFITHKLLFITHKHTRMHVHTNTHTHTHTPLWLPARYAGARSSGRQAAHNPGRML